MLTYTYEARDLKTGEKIKAEIEADSERTAARLLTERHLAPLDIQVKGEKSSFYSFRNRVSSKEKVIFSRQLSTLINAGLPLVQSLSTVRGQTSSRALKAVISQIITDVEGGSPLADALARHPRIFSNVYVSLIAAGEASGTLDVSLERLANQQEKDAEIISKVRGALIYPALVLLVLAAVVIFMLTTVLPQVENFYKGIPGAKLPALTIALLGVAHFLTHFWWAILIFLGISIFFGVRWARTEHGTAVIDELKMHLWPIGPLYMKLYMARFARTGGTLIAAGIPIIKMLNTTAQAVGNVHIAHSINEVGEKVKGGKSIAVSMEGDPRFLELVPNMLRIGEESGQLESMMGKVADYYEKEVDTQIQRISTIIEPVLMIIVGVLALLIVAAVLLPIYGLASKNLIHQ